MGRERQGKNIEGDDLSKNEVLLEKIFQKKKMRVYRQSNFVSLTKNDNVNGKSN